MRQKGGRERKRNRRLFKAAALTGVGAFLVAGLVEVGSHSAGRKVGDGAVSSTARVAPALATPDRSVIPETKAGADSPPSAAQQPRSAGSIEAPEPSASPRPSVLQEPTSAPRVAAASKTQSSDGALPSVFHGEDLKHSGVIVSVSADTHTIVIEEMGPWSGPDSKPHIQTVRLTSRTVTTQASRSDEAPSAGDWPGGFRESEAQVADLRPGHFVTVTGSALSDEIIAELVAISQPPALDLPWLSEGRASLRR